MRPRNCAVVDIRQVVKYRFRMSGTEKIREKAYAIGGGGASLLGSKANDEQVLKHRIRLDCT